MAKFSQNPRYNQKLPFSFHLSYRLCYHPFFPYPTKMDEASFHSLDALNFISTDQTLSKTKTLSNFSSYKSRKPLNETTASKMDCFEVYTSTWTHLSMAQSKIILQTEWLLRWLHVSSLNTYVIMRHGSQHVFFPNNTTLRGKLRKKQWWDRRCCKSLRLRCTSFLPSDHNFYRFWTLFLSMWIY